MDYLTLGVKLALGKNLIFWIDFCPFFWHFGIEEFDTCFRIAAGPFYIAVMY